MLPLPARSYSEKGVQTEWSMVPAVYELVSRQKVLADFAGLAIGNHPGGDYSESAYTQREASEMTNAPSRVNDKTWLGYNRPSCVSYDSWRRVVSLPESCPVGHDKEDAIKGNPRVVSMPEPLSRILASTGCSVNVSKNHVKHLEEHLPYQRGYPPDLPQTPSPPSSPESIIVFGNNLRVPGSIFQQDEAESGWNAWTYSPPRPIPALHGPSSLPYARCPSGAEGTVVEGDDLAHKVWGLANGSDISHPKPPFNHYGDVDYPAVPSPPYPRDTVTDYSNTSTAPKAHMVLHPSFDDTTLACPTTTGFPTDCMSAESRIDLANLSSYTARYGKQDRIGRAECRPQNSTALHNTSSQNHHSATHRLSSTAPVFVPTNYTLPYASGDAYTVQDMNFGHEELPKMKRHRNPAAPKNNADLLTSSSTKAFHPTGSYDPRIYSPQTDMMDGHWNGFAIQPEFFSAQHQLLAETIYPMERFYSPACTIDSSSCATVLPSVALGSSDLDTLHQSNEAYNSALELPQASKPPTSSLVRRRDLSYQRPRSIPLARLIQRRLSSVAEEDTTDSRFHLVSATLANADSFTPMSSRMESCLETTDKTAHVKPHAWLKT